MSTLLQITDITKRYENQPRPALNHVSFQVNGGEFLGIMGASGSGKTTLLNVLSTIDRPDSGDICMDGTKIQTLNQVQAADFRKKNLGFIFQEYFLLDSLTVRENIVVPLTLLHQSPKTIDAKINQLAILFDISSQLEKYPSELSGGQRQRAAALLFALSRANQTLHTTILMVTHDPYAASCADRILYFRDGRIMASLNRSGRDRSLFYEEILRESARQDEKR